ncbi:MAG TPA: hypothetical protein VMC07_01760, partial [Candidatus Omnitrophota bacterium]|nr:hypothetical protein [Candidatus Omnitrophota bacterium]
IQLQNENLNINSKASVFDTKLHDLLQEHTFLLINTIRRSLDSSASYNASLVALKNNINEVGALLFTIYGKDSSQLVNLWNTKTAIFINYSNAVKINDYRANSTFNAAASAYENNVASFWSSNQNAYPILDYSTMLGMATDHMNDVKSAVDAWNTKNYALYFTDLETAYNQMGAYADTIANGIISQHSDLFK